MMMASAARPARGRNVLAEWAQSLTGQAAGRSRGRLRFAFYGRVSTEDWQDPVTSRARQLQQAVMLVAGHGVIVAEFFDTGESRTLPWARRPQAAALVAQLADPDRGWDAIVIGSTSGRFTPASTRRWRRCSSITASACGCPKSAAGSTGTLRTTSRPCSRSACPPSGRSPAPGSGSGPRWRPRPGRRAATWAAWPPYGYRLADAGPHPNKAHDAWGRRAHRLEPDPATAPVVRWMFAQRLAGHSAARITRALNDAGIPCPSAADPRRNPHRTGARWTLRTVAAILANPRYTGRQVWNRQRTDFDLVDPANTGLGHKQVQRWNLPEGWVISKQPAHPALVSEADFIAAQDTAVPRGPAARRYLLAGLLACGRCGRKLESAWSNGKPAYRCRHGYTSATRPDLARPKNTYVREDQILPHLAAIAILIHEPTHPASRTRPSLANVTTPARAADLIDSLRTAGVILTYDPGQQTLRVHSGVLG